MFDSENLSFDAATFLASAGAGRTIVTIRGKETFFSQGEIADSVFYLQSGGAKQTIVAMNGKEATITHLSPGDFIGEESLASIGTLRMATVTATRDCSAMKIERGEMLRVMHEEHPLAAVFLQYLLARGMRIQSDLVDQLFNSSEKRLACVLLLMAEYGESGDSNRLLPDISEQTLAEVVGTTASKVTFFLNRFRELGLIEYGERIRVHNSLLNVLLHDHFPDDNATKPLMSEISRRRSKSPKSGNPIN